LSTAGKPDPANTAGQSTANELARTLHLPLTAKGFAKVRGPPPGEARSGKIGEGARARLGPLVDEAWWVDGQDLAA